MTRGPDILLATINASYIHTAFGLRYLYANMGNLQPSTQLIEFTIAQSPAQIAEIILQQNAKILGLGIYIWNTEESRKLVSILKGVRPELIIVLGGPEVSFETEQQALTQLADFVIQGEADLLFGELCQKILTSQAPQTKIIAGPLPDVESLLLPYRFYSASDIANRVVYVEASRGCPYKCEYCLSSLDKSVRNFSLEVFLDEMSQLLQKGVRQFKFVDRTFNLSVATSSSILEFFLKHTDLGLFLHFEMVPDRLPIELRDLIRQFPKGSLQFEIGIQSLNPEVANLVSRRQNVEKIKENFRFLQQEAHVHTHADLIAGLPGETVESFAQGFDQLLAMGPDEIQVGILKRLKGTPIIRHDQQWAMVYSDHSPFTVLSTKTMNFSTLQTMKRFAKFWDLYANSGNFRYSLALVLANTESSFWRFMEFTKFLSSRHHQSFGISLENLAESLWLFGLELKIEEHKLRNAILQDYCAGAVQRSVPQFLRLETTNPYKVPGARLATPKRQQRHLALLPNGSRPANTPPSHEQALEQRP